MSFSSLAKEELLRLPLGKNCCVMSELSALVQTSGSLQLRAADGCALPSGWRARGWPAHFPPAGGGAGADAPGCTLCSMPGWAAGAAASSPWRMRRRRSCC